MKRIFWVATLVAVLGAPVGVAFADHNWGNYHWGGTKPVPITFVDNVNTAWDSEFGAAIAAWDTPLGGHEKVVDPQGVSDSTEKNRCDSVGDKVQVCNGRYGNNGWLGLARIWIGHRNHIQFAKVKLNDTYLRRPGYGPNARLHVMCHELGHAFGLGHRRSGKSCLNIQSGVNSGDHTGPDDHDFEQLVEVYSHNPTATSPDETMDGHMTVERSGKYTILTHRFPAR